MIKMNPSNGVVLLVLLAVPSVASSANNKHLLKSAEPTVEEIKAVDWVLNRPDKHLRTTWASLPEVIRVRTRKGVRGVGVFSRGMGLTSVQTRQNGRELFFSPTGKHHQTNLITENSSGSIETTRAFTRTRRGHPRWDHTNVWYKKTGRSVHYTPRKGSRPTPGVY